MMFFFFNDTATTEIYTLSLHDALPILASAARTKEAVRTPNTQSVGAGTYCTSRPAPTAPTESPMPGEALLRSEEHTSELQSRQYLVCRLLLEKKQKTLQIRRIFTQLAS